jgi:hypothetical protein
MKQSLPFTFSVLTIPEREEYLTRFFDSVRALRLESAPRIDVIYNHHPEQSIVALEQHIRGLAPDMVIDVYVNSGETSIVGGRNLQLSVCRTPLIAFVDDDVSVHDDIVSGILETLAEHPVALVGFRSFDGDTDRVVKPRASTPFVDSRTLRFMPVQGMLCAGYRALIADVGGFNPRRRYWGEWTELNLRLWRNGYPTAYQMGRGYLRHWEAAPRSPTRNMDGRERHVVWGLICTALEYDATDASEATEVFWQLIEERYLAYSYGSELSPKNVLRTVLEILPDLSSAWGGIQATRSLAATHPFKFAPFHRFTLDEVEAVYRHASTSILPYRARVSAESSDPPGPGVA